MWKEILITDNEGLQEYTNIWNNRIDCKVNLDINSIKRILKKKKDAHCYLWSSEVTGVKITIICKHDIYDDTTYVTHRNNNLDWHTQKNDLAMVTIIWDGNNEIGKILLDTFHRPVKWIKYRRDVYEDDDYKARIRPLLIIKWKEWGIKATEFKHYWILELM